MVNRKGFIGGSDVAGILGIPMLHENGERARWSPTPWSVWAETVGLLDDRDEGDTERQDIGTDAERFLAAVYERHHRNLFVIAEQETLTHPDYPWLRGHQDGLISRHPVTVDPIAGWEAKTTIDLRPWSEIPAYYQCQAQTYMILTGLPEWHFTVGFGRWQVEHYIVKADPEDQALILEETERFWHDHVVPGIPPATDGEPATTEAIKHAYNVPDADDVLWADEETETLVAELRDVRAAIKTAGKRRDELENRIKALMADCAELKAGDQTLVTWRPQEIRRLDIGKLQQAAPWLVQHHYKTIPTRVFRVKTNKGARNG